MKDVINLFQERKEEVEIYFEHAKCAWSDDAKMTFTAGNVKQVTKLSLKLKQILSANTFLLIYNLVESTVSSAIEAIYREIKAEKISYDHIRPNIQKEIIENIRKNINTNDFVGAVNEITIDVVNHHPKLRELFSGNVDQIAIKDISLKYGFSNRTDAQKTDNGKKLETIRKRRNLLAHGFISFTDCGRERDITEMEELKNESLLYIEQILNNIDQFLKDKQYLKP
ncbi:MAG: hypothetical protein RLZZ628_1426 [Bacteroidota bacterium]|jgi:hypothetical protein